MIDPYSFGEDARCYGKGCPRVAECARYDRKKSPKHFLWTAWNKDRKDCKAFKNKIAPLHIPKTSR